MSKGIRTGSKGPLGKPIRFEKLPAGEIAMRSLAIRVQNDKPKSKVERRINRWIMRDVKNWLKANVVADTVSVKGVVSAVQDTHA